MRALRRVMPDLDLELDAIPAEILNTMTVTQNDCFVSAETSAPAYPCVKSARRSRSTSLFSGMPLVCMLR